MRKKKIKPIYVAAFILTGIMIAFTVLGIFWRPFDPDAMSGSLKFAKPTWQHIMGCDNFGRDVFSRVLRGASTSFIIAVVTTVISALMGTVIGGFSAYFGKTVDAVLMRIVDVIAAFPSVLLAMVMIAILNGGGYNKYKITLALIIAFIPSFTRVMRGEFLKYSNLEFVKSARLMGASPVRILALHVFPVCLHSLVSAATIGFNNAILAEASMSYLGLGVQPPDASLGYMLSEGQAYITSGPWLVIGPGVFMVLLILGMGLIGDYIGENTHA